MRRDAGNAKYGETFSPCVLKPWTQMEGFLSPSQCHSFKRRGINRFQWSYILFQKFNFCQYKSQGCLKMVCLRLHKLKEEPTTQVFILKNESGNGLTKLKRILIENIYKAFSLAHHGSITNGPNK